MRSVARLGKLVLGLLFLLASQGALAAISVSDNNTHIDRGVAYTNSAFLTASGGTAPYTFQVTAGLPMGIVVNSQGQVSGMTCQSNGNFGLTLTVTDALGATASPTNLSIIVNAAPSGGCSLTFSSSTLPSGTVGVAYSGTVTATGGTSPYTYSVISGSLPTGLTLNTSTGAISGTPTTAGSSTFTIYVTDSSAKTGSQTYSITISVAAPTITLSPTSLTAGTAGTAYSQTITASGGTSPYTYAVTSGSLPTGMSLSSGGALGGTPTVAGSYNFTITATDANSYTGNRAYSLTINAPTITVSPSSLTAGTAGTAYSQTFTASGGASPYTYTITTGALPVGLSLSSGGTLTGTPTADGTYNFTVTATDSNGYVGNRALALTINTPTITVSPSSPTAGTAGTSFSQSFTASGGASPYTYAVTSGSLPAGLSLSSAGVLTGTPTVAGVYSFTITATDNNGYTGSQAVSLTINTPTIAVSPVSLSAGTAGTSYSQTITASGGASAYSYAVTSGTLPNGMSLSSGGALTGTPTTAGAYSFTITATDANTYTGSRAYSLTINTPTITLSPTTLTAGTAGTSYSQSISAAGGASPYTYAVTAGSLPPGMSLGSGGALTNAPTAAGSYNFTITATDNNGYTGSQALALTINTPTIMLSPTSLAAGSTTESYSQGFTASGGAGPYTYAITSGSLPSGLSLSSGGALTGTPAATGPFSFTITATDNNGYTGSQALSLTISATPTITLSPTSLSAGTAHTSYSQSFTASGGTGPYTYAITSGSLPTGLSLSSAGALIGTPTATGSFSFTITATDNHSYTGSQTLSLTIAAPTITVSPTSLSAGTDGTSYSQNFTASGGTGPYTYAVTSGSLPSGLSLSSGGALTGTPTASGVFSFTITATDSNSYTGSQALSLTINASPTVTVNLGGSSTGTVGTAYSQTFTASGGTGPYTYAVTVGTLPPGVTLNSSTGVLSGTPTTSGPYSFTVTATDSNNYTGSQAVSFTVSPAPTITLSPTSLSAGTAQTSYSQSFSASGGTGPYTYAVTSGSLPTGLSLNSGGALTGTPTATGSFSFTITATDSNSYTGGQALSLTINAPTIMVSLGGSSAGTVGSAYSQTFSASGGTGPYTYSVTAGSLPPGVTLNSSTGVLSGTPTANGSYTFTVTATDNNGFTGSQSQTLTIGTPPTITLSPTSLSIGTIGSSYSQNITATGGTGPYVYSVSSGSLPPGLVLDSNTGQLSGTPTTNGSYAFTLTATDADHYTGSQAFSLTIGLDPTTEQNFRDLLANEAAAVQRFTNTQITNVVRRLEDLHNGAGSSNQFCLSVSTSAAPGKNAEDSQLASLCPGGQSGTSAKSKIAVWAAGTLDYGDASPIPGVGNGRFSSSGMTVGADYRLADNRAVGFAFGYAFDDIAAGTHGSQITTQSVNVIGYGGWKLTHHISLDGLAGFGSTALDMQRHIDADNSDVTGKRPSSSVFGALIASAGFDFKPLQLNTYVRGDYSNATLGDYQETGATNLALSYDSASVQSTSLTAGVRLGYAFRLGIGRLEPSLRVEYQNRQDSALTQKVHYLDQMSGPAYSYILPANQRELFNLGFSARYVLTRSTSAKFEYQTQQSGGDTVGRSLRTSLAIAF